MSRLLLAAAGLLAASCALGAGALIAADMLGEEGLRSLVTSLRGTAAAPPLGSGSPVVASAGGSFQPTKAITFFDTVPIEGTSLSVSTGAAYDSIADVEARRPARQWCYVNVDTGRPGFAGRIDLGSQDGDAPPSLTPSETLTGVDLGEAGVPSGTLATLAESHCRFNQLDPLA